MRVLNDVDRSFLPWVNSTVGNLASVKTTEILKWSSKPDHEFLPA